MGGQAQESRTTDRPETIEAALGAEVSILPAALRTRELRAASRATRWTCFHYFATQERTTVSHVLTRELDDLASANAEELSAVLPVSPTR